MKNTVLSFLALSTLFTALAVPVCAQKQVSLKGDIPFEFVVGNTTMPAGEYTIKAGGDGSRLAVVRIQSADYQTSVNVLSVSAYTGKNQGESKLVFHRYGSQYFLSQIWSSGRSEGRQLPGSRTERELVKSASAGPSQTVILLAKR